MYSKELTLRRNGALKYRRDYLNENSDVQIKLKFKHPKCKHPKLLTQEFNDMLTPILEKILLKTKKDM